MNEDGKEEIYRAGAIKYDIDEGQVPKNMRDYSGKYTLTIQANLYDIYSTDYKLNGPRVENLLGTDTTKITFNVKYTAPGSGAFSTVIIIILLIIVGGIVVFLVLRAKKNKKTKAHLAANDEDEKNLNFAGSDGSSGTGFGGGGGSKPSPAVSNTPSSSDVGF
jgi:hypothetical protein